MAEQIHGRRMSESVRGHLFFYKRREGLTRGGDMSGHQSLEGIGTEARVP